MQWIDKQCEVMLYLEANTILIKTLLTIQRGHKFQLISCLKNIINLRFCVPVRYINRFEISLTINCVLYIQGYAV
jgi:hypothetical protein